LISISVRNGFAFLHRINWDPYNEAQDLISSAKKPSMNMAVIHSDSAPIGFISTPRIATSVPGATYGHLVSD
jgi:hypothetical protein